MEYYELKKKLFWISQTQAMIDKNHTLATSISRNKKPTQKPINLPILEWTSWSLQESEGALHFQPFYPIQNEVWKESQPFSFSLPIHKSYKMKSV